MGKKSKSRPKSAKVSVPPKITAKWEPSEAREAAEAAIRKMCANFTSASTPPKRSLVEQLDALLLLAEAEFKQRGVGTLDGGLFLAFGTDTSGTVDVHLTFLKETTVAGAILLLRGMDKALAEAKLQDALPRKHTSGGTWTTERDAD